MARPKRPHAKLTPDQVKELRHLLALRRQLTLKALEARFGIHRSAIWKIANGETWSDVA